MSLRPVSYHSCLNHPILCASLKSMASSSQPRTSQSSSKTVDFEGRITFDAWQNVSMRSAMSTLKHESCDLDKCFSQYGICVFDVAWRYERPYFFSQVGEDGYGLVYLAGRTGLTRGSGPTSAAIKSFSCCAHRTE